MNELLALTPMYNVSNGLNKCSIVQHVFILENHPPGQISSVEAHPHTFHAAAMNMN